MRLNLTKRVLGLWLVILVTLTISVGLKLANIGPPVHEWPEFVDSLNLVKDAELNNGAPKTHKPQIRSKFNL